VRVEVDGVIKWVDREVVQIFIPGDAKAVPVQKVTDEHRDRWPQHYQAFKSNQEPSVDGTPLEMWGGLSKAQVANLKAANIRTVEDIAGLTDGQLDAVGRGARELRIAAQSYVKLQEDRDAAEFYAREADRERAEKDLTKAQLSEALERLEALEAKMAAGDAAPPRRGPGRPKKETDQ